MFFGFEGMFQWFLKVVFDGFDGFSWLFVDDLDDFSLFSLGFAEKREPKNRKERPYCGSSRDIFSFWLLKGLVKHTKVLQLVLAFVFSLMRKSF